MTSQAVATDPTQNSETDLVDFWFDPVCPWTWMASQWLLEVEKVRPVRVAWHVMSLSYLNAGRDMGEKSNAFLAKAWAPVRVVIAAQELHGARYVKALYDALGTRIHLDKNTDFDQVIAESLSEVGLPSSLAEYGDRDTFDDALKASHHEGMDQVGTEVGTPVIALNGHAFFGPVMSPAPKGQEAGVVWDGVKALASYDGFFELRRSRTREPIFD